MYLYVSGESMIESIQRCTALLCPEDITELDKGQFNLELVDEIAASTFGLLAMVFFPDSCFRGMDKTIERFGLFSG